MKIDRIIKAESFLSIIGAIGILTWWFSMLVFLPVKDASADFSILILDKNRVQVNSIGLISTLLLCMGFPGFYVKFHDKFNKLGFYGLLIASAGLVYSRAFNITKPYCGLQLLK